MHSPEAFPEPVYHSRHSHRKRVARIYLACIALLLMAADAILLWFSFSPQSPSRLLVGVVILQVMASGLLIGAVWARQGWARYVLGGLLLGVGAAFAMTVLTLGSRPGAAEKSMLLLVSVAVAQLIGAAAWLLASRRIRYLATAPGSGG